MTGVPPGTITLYLIVSTCTVSPRLPLNFPTDIQTAQKKQYKNKHVVAGDNPQALGDLSHEPQMG